MNNNTNYQILNLGQLKVRFSNQDTQEILLDGLLLRPNIKINMRGYEGEEEEKELIDFDTVHVRN